MDYIESNWLLILLVLAVAVAIAWYVFHAARRTRVTGDRRDVLDEGAQPASRNQALIDAAPSSAAASIPPPAPAGLAGAGEAVQAAAEPTRQAAQDRGDDLTRLKGIGPKLAAQLAALGVTGFQQIAAWSEADVDRIDSQLGRFQGRIRRDNWVEQAKLLADRDDAGFAARFGNIS